jgi:sporulation protein YlmC with PRC-barrel domain
MNKVRQFRSKVVIATLCLSGAGWLVAQAQNAPIEAPKNLQAAQPETTAPFDQPMRMINRCTKLIGATVRNQQGYILGKIEDVVVDINTGRVVYCALKVKQPPFAKAKYLAVPVAALQPSVDALYLVLNADKDRVAQAKGFDANHWPELNDPAWGAQPFWDPKDEAYSPPHLNNPTGMQASWNPPTVAARSAIDVNRIPPVGNGP